MSTMMELGGEWENRNLDSLVWTWYFLSACLHVGATDTGVCHTVFARSEMALLIGKAIFEEEEKWRMSMI